MVGRDGRGMRYELIATMALAALLDVGMPVVLGLVLWKRLGARWWLFVVGAFAFVASQVVHIPLVMGSTLAFREHWLPSPPDSWWWFNPVVLGLLAGLCEEPARWLAFRFVLRRDADRSREGALMVGAGHGGIESIFVGALIPLTLVNMIAMHGMTAEQIGGLGGGQLDAATAAAAAEQVAEFWATPAWHALLGALERATAITFHVAMSALVAYGIRRGATAWTLPLAIALHALLDALAVHGAAHWGTLAVETALLAFVVPVAAVVLVATWRRSAKPNETEAQ